MRPFGPLLVVASWLSLSSSAPTSHTADKDDIFKRGDESPQDHAPTLVIDTGQTVHWPKPIKPAVYIMRAELLPCVSFPVIIPSHDPLTRCIDDSRAWCQLGTKTRAMTLAIEETGGEIDRLCRRIPGDGQLVI